MLLKYELNKVDIWCFMNNTEVELLDGHGKGLVSSIL